MNQIINQNNLPTGFWRKFFSLNNRLFSVLVGLIFAGVFCAGVYVFATDWPYTPPAPLNPGCAPTDIDCIVKAPLTDGFTTSFSGTGDFTTTTGTITAGTLAVEGEYTLPTADGTNGQVLQTNGSGTVTWETGPGLPSGTSGQTLRYDGANWVANSLLYNNGTNVGIGTTSPAQVLDVVGSIAIPTTIDSTSGVIYKGSDPFIHNFAGTGTNGFNTFVGINAGNFTMGGTGSDGSYNTGIGQEVLLDNTTGYQNEANGTQALTSNTTGYRNAANGFWALYSNTEGSYNTAAGPGALAANTTGNGNTANGAASLLSNTTGSSNTANGANALHSNTEGSGNTANGENALYSNTTGSGNVALGPYAGYYETGSNTFYVNNYDTSDSDISNSLLYGKFNTNPNLQTLRINGRTLINGATDDNASSLLVTAPGGGSCDRHNCTNESDCTAAPWDGNCGSTWNVDDTCTGSSCDGTPTDDCSTHDGDGNEADCSADLPCSSNAHYCDGTVSNTYCATWTGGTADNCDSNSGSQCSMPGGDYTACLPISGDCSTWSSNESDCGNMGCDYHASTCTYIISDCSAWNAESSNCGLAGCTWTDCSAFSDQSTCTTGLNGCTWNPSSCTDSDCNGDSGACVALSARCEGTWSGGAGYSGYAINAAGDVNTKGVFISSDDSGVPNMKFGYNALPTNVEGTNNGIWFADPDGLINTMMIQSGPKLLEMTANEDAAGNRNTDYPGTKFQLDARGAYGRFKIYTQDANDSTEYTVLNIDESKNTNIGYNLNVAGNVSILGGSYHTIFQGGSQSGDITYTLPTADGSAGQVLSTDGSGTLSWASAGGLPSGTSGYTLRYDGADWIANDFLYNNGTNVGIGTTSPGQTLTVEGTLGILETGSSPAYHTIFQGGDQSADITYTLPIAAGTNGQFLRTNGSGALSWASGAGGGLPSGTSGQTLRYDGGGEEWVANDFLYNDGTKVGIGTTSPAQALDVNGNINIPTTAASEGVITTGAIMMDNSPFIHALGSNNFYAGINAGSIDYPGSGNIAIGNYTIYNAGPAGNADNIAIGWNALHGGGSAGSLVTSQNVAVGYDALPKITTGASNTAVGAYAMQNPAGGSERNTALGALALAGTDAGTIYASWNTAVGYAALNQVNSPNSDIGYDSHANSALGYGSLFYLTTGIANTAVGYNSGVYSTTGNFNTFLGSNTGVPYASEVTKATAIGYNARIDISNGMALGGTGADAVYVGIGTATPAQALDVVGSIAIPTTIDSTSGVIYKGTDRFIHNFALAGTDGANTFVGINAGNFTMAGSEAESGSYNTGIGQDALTSNTTGSSNTANGFNALSSNTTGYRNTANGINALYQNTTGSFNTATGGWALASNTTGDNNTANGLNALAFNTTGHDNTANGNSALYSNTTGNNNTATGFNALYSNTTGRQNTANGEAALHSNIGGQENTANGYQALYSNTEGHNNTATGFLALQNNTTGHSNTANGDSALLWNTTGHWNTANGVGALTFNTTGNENTANGHAALFSLTTGDYNTAYGSKALLNTTSASNNVAIGYYAGAYEQGSNAFYVNNYNTTSSELDKTNSLLYGTFDPNPANQTLFINGRTIINGATDDNVSALQVVSGGGGCSQHNCTNESYCVATPWDNNCGSTWNETGDCSGSYDPGTGVCDGTPVNCHTWDSNGETCLEKPQCTWNDPSCDNTIIACSHWTGSQENDSTCAGAGCTWTEDSGDCSIFNNNGDVCGSEECTWNDTSSCTDSSCSTRIPCEAASHRCEGTWSPLAYAINATGNVNITGKIRLEGATSGYVQIQPKAAAGSWTMTLPDSAGTAGQSLQTDGSGNLSWASGLPSGTSGQTLRNDGSGWVANSVLYNNGTDVGIGTTSPDNLLQVYDLIDFDNTYFNTKLGYQAGKNITIGEENTAIGYQALHSNTIGGNNIAIGFLSLFHNSSGSGNIAVGSAALDWNTTGSQNIAIGMYTLEQNTTGSHNTAVGSAALDWNTTGYGNTANGDEALYSNTTGYYNTATGANALYSNTTGADNVATGNQALAFNTTGIDNIATGFQALYSNTTGYENIATGDQTLYFNTTGHNNTATGFQALYSNTTGSNNTATGDTALYSNTTGASNTANGVQALLANTTGIDNTANGYQALYSNTEGIHNVATGYQALYTNTTGGNNVANGWKALFSNTTGTENTANGVYALTSNTTGSDNTANGFGALYTNTTGNENTATGSGALESNTTGATNTATGANVLEFNTTGYTNTANGGYALEHNTTGYGNTANGAVALQFNTTGYYNTATGVEALNSNTSGTDNTAIGYDALFSNTTGTHNTANGGQALYSNTEGYHNTANGFNALFANTEGINNTANGASALNYNTTGDYNTANGSLALYHNITGSGNTANGNGALAFNTEGTDNTATGHNALFSLASGSYNTAYGTGSLSATTTGSNNVALGYYAGAYETGDNTFYVGNQDPGATAEPATGRAKALLYGVFDANPTNQALTLNGAFILGGNYGSDPTTPAPVEGELYYNTSSHNLKLYDGSWKTVTVSSSLRYKHNIQPLADDWNAILQVQPKSFVYNGDSDTQINIGYIAEDFDALGLNDLVQYDNENRPNGINYDRITLYDTEIIKQQQIDINAIKQLLGITVDNSVIINPAGTSGSGEVSGVTITPFDQSVQSSLSKLGATLSGGIITLKQVITDTLTVKTARIEKMEMVDSSTGNIYCTWVENGEWKKVQGDCASVALANVPEPTPPAEIPPLEETTSPSTEAVTPPAETPPTTPNDQVSQQINDLSQQVSQQQQATQQAQQTAQQAQDTANQAQEIAQQIQQQVQQQPPALNIVSITNIPDINVAYGTQLASTNLPTTVIATLSDNSTQSVTIVWDNGMPTYDASASGTYVFSGTLTFSGNITNTNNLEINVNVTVAQQPPPIESPVSITGDLIKNTVSGLLNGVLEFMGGLIDSGSKAISSLQIVRAAGSSLIQASAFLQSLSSSLGIKSLTTGVFEQITKLFSK